ncbi:MAG TPA: type I phosphomannose isomerase catalytic subunit [Aquaticitalea sp.]|nr:type I phosphomannose isomerase catalytic subunit [Aquaticitalea sp.]
MKSNLYPIKFKPILKDKIWGGQKLNSILNKESTLPNIGESWEISDVDNDISIVNNGSLEGQSLKQILNTHKGDLVGAKNYQQFGNKFPLLVKFIDAKEDLSIQLHPNDELAKKRHNSFGKTEMWFVMQADEGANLIVGFNQKVTPQIYLEHLENKTLTQILNLDEVGQGDTYFIDVGRVHAIGAGVLLAEIQQTSDITYRVYDWDRTDDQGKARELHNDLALDAIGFEMPNDFRVKYQKDKNISNEMVSCPYFTTNFLPVTSPVHKVNVYDSFIIYMCVNGKTTIEANGIKTQVSKGETVLIPAALKNIVIHPKIDSELLEVYIK